jgi:hypothetical protein
MRRRDILKASRIEWVRNIIPWLLTVFIVGFTGWMAFTTQKTFRYAYRPYVGIKRVDLGIFPDSIRADAVMYNSGAVPATEVKVAWEILGQLGDSLLPCVSREALPTILFPKAETKLGFNIAGNIANLVVAGQVDLVAILRIDYKGIDSKEFLTETKFIYQPHLKRFGQTSGQVR